MKTTILQTANKALSVLLMASILAVGAYAVHLTKVHATVTVTFGDALPQTFAVADAVDLSQLEMPAIPPRKPKLPK